MKKCDHSCRFIKLVYDDEMNGIVTRRCLRCGDLVEEALKKAILAEALRDQAVQGLA